MNLKEQISAVIKGDVADDGKTLAEYSHDASIFEIRPRIVVFPKDAEDIEALVRFVNDHPDLKLSLTPRSAGTDMTGGAIGTSIIVECDRYLNHLKEVGDGYAVTEPGVYYRDFEKQTLAKDWLLPSYPASREICTVGGMAANNSGGEKSLRYGKTENYIQALQVVLADGSACELKPLDKAALDR